MYTDFYGLREKPFSLLPDPDYLYLSGQHNRALTMLEYGVMNRAGISVISGEVGSGKTTLVRHLLNRLEEDVTVGLIANTHRAFGELLQWVLLAYGLDYQGREKAALYEAFVAFLVDEYAAGRRVLLIVDEAQNLSPEGLEELRVLSNVNADKHQVLDLILVGQPELHDTLRRPDLLQLAQRVAVQYHLGTLSAEETDAYIRHRLEVAGGDPELFEPLARRFIHYLARGVPRVVNVLCDTALVYGYAEQRERIDVDLVRAVVRDRGHAGPQQADSRHGEEGVAASPEESLRRARTDLADGPASAPDGTKAVRGG